MLSDIDELFDFDGDGELDSFERHVRQEFLEEMSMEEYNEENEDC